jgi:hypothetical protein
MGSLNPFKTPKVKDLGPSQFELDQQKRMAEKQAFEEEEKRQQDLGRRGRRSLMAETNTGSGYRSMIS